MKKKLSNSKRKLFDFLITLKRDHLIRKYFKDNTLFVVFVFTCLINSTLIRIFTTGGGVKFSEFRRGTKNVTMNCLSFDLNNKFIGCISNVGTMHVFSIAGIMKILNENSDEKNKKRFEEEPKNSKSFLGKIGGFFNLKNAYLETERNFARFKIMEENSLLGFGSDNTFVVLTMDGKYYKAAYDPKKGGECCKIEEKNVFVDM